MKFTDRGSVTLKVERYNNKLNFSVTDTGVGISSTEKIYKQLSKILISLYSNQR
nr:hypothetical protein [Dactylococcopsis salina]